MTKEQKIIRAKVGLLELAELLGNVSQACKMLGYSRDSFYRFKELYDKGGDLALAEMSHRKPILANRTPPEIEAQIVTLSLEQPAFGQIRVSNELRKRGLSISPAGVRRSFSPSPSALRQGTFASASCRSTSALDVAAIRCIRGPTHQDRPAARQWNGTPFCGTQRDAIKLIEHGLVEALADTVGLRALRLGARVIDVLDREIELIRVPLWIAAVLAPAVGQHA